MSPLIDDIRTRAQWLTEGAYRSAWIQPLLADADRIVWLDVPMATCALRMVRRHVVAEIRGSNIHPGWQRLVSFINYTRRTVPTQRAETARLLAPYTAKVVHCRFGGQQSMIAQNL